MLQRDPMRDREVFRQAVDLVRAFEGLDASDKVRKATDAEDLLNATDLTVTRDGETILGVGVRFRTPHYWRFRDEVTFRSGVVGGGPTEIDKVMDGCGDRDLYGHLDTQGRVIQAVYLDLHGLRYHFQAGTLRFGPAVSNGDGSMFRTVKVADLMKTSVTGIPVVVGVVLNGQAGCHLTAEPVNRLPKQWPRLT